jgi:hypothetical protein
VVVCIYVWLIIRAGEIGVTYPKLISEITKVASGKFAAVSLKKNFLNLFTFEAKCLKNEKRQRLQDM